MGSPKNPRYFKSLNRALMQAVKIIEGQRDKKMNLRDSNWIGFEQKTFSGRPHKFEIDDPLMESLDSKSQHRRSLSSVQVRENLLSGGPEDVRRSRVHLRPITAQTSQHLLHGSPEDVRRSRVHLTPITAQTSQTQQKSPSDVEVDE